MTGISLHGVTLVLVLFGVGLTLGNTLGGRLADRALMPSLMGILAFATAPLLQMRVLEKVHVAPNLASTLNIGAFNIGNAGAAWLDGAVITHGGG